MQLQRLLYSDAGRNIISVLLGIGLATLFQKVCKDKDCVIFNGPVISEIDGKIFQHGDKCYKYDITSSSCDKNKKEISMSSEKNILSLFSWLKQ